MTCVIREASLVKREDGGGRRMRTDRGWVSGLAMVFMIVLQATVGLAADPT